jgi:hypothetical protein
MPRTEEENCEVFIVAGDGEEKEGEGETTVKSCFGPTIRILLLFQSTVLQHKTQAL